MIRKEIRVYIESEILPRYDGFDAAHRRDHADVVVSRSVELAQRLGADVEMAYVIAAYHDTGLAVGRDVHHTESKRILLADRELKRWFSEEDIATMGDAVEDHRASSKQPPRTIYGRIVAEADRLIVPHSIIRRTVQFTLTHHPDLDMEQGYERLLEHMREKYDYGGYLKLWIEESDNAQRLEELRKIIADKPLLRRLYESIYAEEIQRVK
ncbi:MAG: HD domain-containing protein [Alistipes sp.]|nr:HD domain-containing protein [Alistipes sp.]